MACISGSRFLGLSGLLVLAVAAVVGGGLAGCSDMITYSNEARESGIEAYNQERYADAAGAFRAALKQDPRDYQSQYFLGMASLKLGSCQQAMVAFRSCLDMRTLTNAGREDTTTAIKAMDGLAQTIVKSDAGDVEVDKVEASARNTKGAAAAQDYFILGKVFRYRGLPDVALDYYNRACIADNKNFDYLKEYGLYCEQLAQAQRAEQSLRQAYAINANDSEVSAALTRLGIVPGLSLRNKEDLSKPLVPKGPIPEMDMNKIKSAFGGGSEPAPARPAPVVTPSPSPAPATGNTALPRD